MLLFQLIALLIFIVNGFVSNILKGYNLVIYLIISLIIFKLLFGYEKDKNRYTNDAIIETIIYLIIFFLLYYLLGVFMGYAKVNSYYSWYGLTTFILPIILTIIFKEILRYNMMRKCENSIPLKIITTILFIFLDISSLLYYNNFNTNYNYFTFIALYVLPSISKNIVMNKIAIRVGFRPNIVYLLIMELFPYLCPIIPNPNEYITSLIQLIAPVFLWSRVKSLFLLEEDIYINRDYKKWQLPTFFILGIFTIIMIYFTSGYFRYVAIVIATGSMEPNIKKGDIVMVKKINKNYDQLKVGDILVFKYEKYIIVHRINRIVYNDGDYRFYTKGDANNDEDKFEIINDNIIGTTNFKIPYLGYPKLWLNE